MSRIKNIPRPVWVVAGVVAALVLIPTAAVAVTSTVIIKGGTVAGQASVSGANQLLTSEADPKSYVIVFSGSGRGGGMCAPGGFYTIPTGKALIITGVNFYNHTGGAGFVEADFDIGPSAAPCTTLVAAGITDGTAQPHLTENQVFQPGITVPAGDALGWSAFNDNGSFDVYGYLVPSTAVAGVEVHGSPGVSAGRSPTMGR